MVVEVFLVVASQVDAIVLLDRQTFARLNRMIARWLVGCSGLLLNICY